MTAPCLELLSHLDLREYVIIQLQMLGIYFLIIKDFCPSMQQSISVTCEVTLWGFCDDRQNRKQRMCVAPGCKPQVVAVYYHEPGMLFCPEQMDGTVFWHNTPVNMSGIAVVVSALRSL